MCPRHPFCTVLALMLPFCQQLGLNANICVCEGGRKQGGQGWRSIQGAASQAEVSPPEGARKGQCSGLGSRGGPHDPWSLQKHPRLSQCVNTRDRLKLCSHDNGLCRFNFLNTRSRLPHLLLPARPVLEFPFPKRRN